MAPREAPRKSAVDEPRREGEGDRPSSSEDSTPFGVRREGGLAEGEEDDLLAQTGEVDVPPQAGPLGPTTAKERLGPVASPVSASALRPSTGENQRRPTARRPTSLEQPAVGLGKRPVSGEPSRRAIKAELPEPEPSRRMIKAELPEPEPSRRAIRVPVPEPEPSSASIEDSTRAELNPLLGSKPARSGSALARGTEATDVPPAAFGDTRLSDVGSLDPPTRGEFADSESGRALKPQAGSYEAKAPRKPTRAEIPAADGSASTGLPRGGTGEGRKPTRAEVPVSEPSLTAAPRKGTRGEIAVVSSPTVPTAQPRRATRGEMPAAPPPRAGTRGELPVAHEKPAPPVANEDEATGETDLKAFATTPAPPAKAVAKPVAKAPPSFDAEADEPPDEATGLMDPKELQRAGRRPSLSEESTASIDLATGKPVEVAPTKPAKPLPTAKSIHDDEDEEEVIPTAAIQLADGKLMNPAPGRTRLSEQHTGEIDVAKMQGKGQNPKKRGLGERLSGVKKLIERTGMHKLVEGQGVRNFIAKTGMMRLSQIHSLTGLHRLGPARFGFQVVIAGLMLLAGAGVVVHIFFSQDLPPEETLQYLYPYGFTGGTQPNGRSAPPVTGVKFKFTGNVDCGSNVCDHFDVDGLDGVFHIEMTVTKRDDGTWALVGGPPVR